MAQPKPRRILEKTIATASFIVAVALVFLSIFLSDDHDVAANVCLVVAQFLTLTATLLGIDYHFNSHGNQFTAGHPQQQSAEPAAL